ncbi:hypothetical protein FISHEDRAFT_54717, partial [Fistulina hepatica ATCC 64428]
FQQLLRAQLWPATSTQPSTAATFSLLHHFDILTSETSVSISGFHCALEQLTDNRLLSDIPLLRIVRQRQWVILCKRFGRRHIEAGLENIQPGELAVECIFCPQPSKNMPDGWEENAYMCAYNYVAECCIQL